MSAARRHIELGLVCIAYLVLMLGETATAQEPSPGKSSDPAVSAAMPTTPHAFANDLLAAQKGDLGAQLRVGRAYYFGRTGASSRPDYASAFKWFEAAYEKGAPQAATWVGVCYVYGYGVPRDVEYGEALVQTAAQQGDSAALTYMGFFYLRGLGVSQDAKKAMQMFLQAAALGNPIAELSLARMYRQGFSVQGGVIEYTAGQGDYAAAVKWYRAAAASHLWAAEFELGQMTERGLGIPRDLSSAQDHYLAAARKRYLPAQLRMGNWHLQQARIHGDPFDLINAYKWYALAALNGSAIAKQDLASVDRQLNPKQRKEALALVEKYSQPRQRQSDKLVAAQK